MGSRISRNQWIYILLIWVAVIGFWWLENHVLDPSDAPESGTAVVTEFPEDFLPKSPEGERVIHPYFLFSYREEHEQAAWVAYTLDRTHLSSESRVRPYYVQDPKVSTESAHWRNYKGSGYDRGHLCPAGDRKFSEEAYNQTFYTSNVSPQESRFNAGIWNALEQQVRRWAHRYGRVHVITGGVLKDNLPAIGRERVTVPEQFFKVVIREEGSQVRALAFVIPHRDSDRALETFVIPLDTLEALSGLDFLAGLEPSQQESLEKVIETKYWKF